MAKQSQHRTKSAKKSTGRSKESTKPSVINDVDVEQKTFDWAAWFKRVRDNRVVLRKIQFPKLIATTKETAMVLWSAKRRIFQLLMLAWVIVLLLVGAAQQDQFTTLEENVKTLVGQSNSIKTHAASIGVTFLSVSTGGLNTSLSDGQQIFTILVYIFMWLALIWLLRFKLAGKDVTLRDSLYNAGAPSIPVLLVVAIGLLQALPAAVGSIIIGAMSAGNFAISGTESVIVTVLAIALILLSIYWIIPTLFGAIIVTIPGTYPIKALRSARLLLNGVRARALVHIVWLAVLLALLFSLTLLPALIINNYVVIKWLPFVAVATQFSIIVTLLAGTTYLYVLYRKVVDARGQH